MTADDSARRMDRLDVHVPRRLGVLRRHKALPPIGEKGRLGDAFPRLHRRRALLVAFDFGVA